MKKMRKILSLVLCFAILVSTVAFSVSASENNKFDCPVVFVTGIGQSQTYVYNEDGSVKADGNLFVINTEFNLKDYLTIAVLASELIGTIFTGADLVDSKTTSALVKSLFKYCIIDEEGKHVDNVETPCYKCPVSEYNEEAKSIFNNRIPCGDFLDEIGEENVYCFNYSPFTNLYNEVDNLDSFINDVVLEQTGAEKVILVPMSMGAAVVSAYLDEYADKQQVSKVISIVGAWDGSDVFADLIERKYSADAPDLVYNGIVSEMIGEPVGYLVNIFLRVMPKQTVTNLINTILGSLIDDFILKTPSLLALIPSERYPAIAEEYLSDESLSYIREQTDRYYAAQSTLKERLYSYRDNYGMEFYFISGYNLGFGALSSDYTYFQFFDSSKKTNSDEIIQISSTGVGTTYAPNHTLLPEDYVAENPICTDPSHNHISPDRSIDVSTSYFPEQTWCFEGQTHELTYNNIALELAFDIVRGNVKSIWDCQDKYPQFNESRDVKRLVRSYIPDAKYAIENGELDAETIAKLEEAIANAEAMVERTICDRDADDKIIKNLYDTMVEAGIYEADEEPSTSDKVINGILKALNDIVYVIVGPRGFVDFVFSIIESIDLY